MGGQIARRSVDDRERSSNVIGCGKRFTQPFLAISRSGMGRNRAVELSVGVRECIHGRARSYAVAGARSVRQADGRLVERRASVRMPIAGISVDFSM
jgi:hypothetical protein